MANSLLVNVPDKKAHAAISILVKGRILTPYVTEGRKEIYNIPGSQLG